MIAWRGVITKDGQVWAWPMLLMDHNTAFRTLPHLQDYVCRWRQWHEGGPIDFDFGCADSDRVKVQAWVNAANEAASV